jgi:hypothetical protein
MNKVLAFAILTIASCGPFCALAADPADGVVIIMAPPNWNKYGQPNLFCTPGYHDFSGADHPEFGLCYVSIVLNNRNSVDPSSSEASIPADMTMKILSEDEVTRRLDELKKLTKQVHDETDRQVKEVKTDINSLATRPVQLADNERDRIIRETTAAVLKQLQEMTGAPH